MAKVSKRYSTISILTAIVAVSWYRGIGLTNVLGENLLRNGVIASWMQWRTVDTAVDTGLKDGIPDRWDILTWGGAKGIFYTDDKAPFAGLRAAVIERTNTSGGAALVQNVSVRSGGQILVSVFAKGEGGAIQVQYRRDNQEPWQNGGWMNIAPTVEWEQYRLSVAIPRERPDVRLLLRSSHGFTSFDKTYFGFEEDGNPDRNLLKNSDFEQDGRDEDPLTWWHNQAEKVPPVRVTEGMFLERDISLKNIVDITVGNFDAIKRRAGELGGNCASKPEMTGWLLALGGTSIETQAEGFYLLARELAPNCPQPYAALAKLYASHLAFKSAADLYHKASELAEGTVLAGRYAFEEGFIHVRFTGKATEAISALRKAEKVKGWESGLWYRGAASLFLGYALESKGMYDEAGQAYRQVIECAICSYHRAEALERLESMKTGVDQSLQEP